MRDIVSNNDVKTTESSKMTGYGMFPVSVIIAGFCVMSIAYLICFCCCIVQFFVRRNRNTTPPSIFISTIENTVLKQKNDKLRSLYCRQYISSLKRFNKTRPANLSVADSSCVGFCPICFEEYQGDPADIFVGLIKTCGHFFHFDCIWEWLENHQTCPLCRGLTQLKETHIRGLSLRHVDAYQTCAQQSGDGHPQKGSVNAETSVAPSEAGDREAAQRPEMDSGGREPALGAEMGVEATEETEEETEEETGEETEEETGSDVVVTVGIEGEDQEDRVVVTEHGNKPHTSRDTDHDGSHTNDAFVVDFYYPSSPSLTREAR